MESVQYSQNAGNSETGTSRTNVTQRTINDTITVGDKQINLTEYFAQPEVKAFRDIYGINFNGEWEIIAPMGSSLFSKFERIKGQVQMAFLDYIHSISEWRAYGLSRNATVKMMIIDGSYLDDKLYLFEFNEPIYNALNVETMEFSLEDKVVNFTQYSKFSVEETRGND